MEERERGSSGMRLPEAVRWFWVGTTVAFGLMFVVGYAEFRAGYPAPHYNPLGGRWFDDLLEYLPTFRLVHTAAFFHNAVTTPVAYPPFGAVLYGLVYWGGHAARVYLGWAAVWLGAGVWGVRQRLVAEGLDGWVATLLPVTVAGMSFPICGLLQRGNLELFVWIFVGGGLWAYVRGWDEAAGALWGLAAAVKLYPVVLLGLLLPRGRWRAFGVGVGVFVGVSWVSLSWLGPSVGVALRGSVQNVLGYQGIRVGELSLHELAANHSALGLVKVAVLVCGGSPARMVGPYYIAGAVVFAGMFFGRLWRMPVVNQVLGVSVFMVLLPPISYFYTLVHLYGAWVMLVLVGLRAERAGVRVPGLRATMLWFVPVFGSFMLFTFRQVFLFGGLVQAGCLVALFVCAGRFRFEVSERVSGVSAECGAG